MNRAEFVARLLHLGLQHGDIPIYGSTEWDALPTANPRRFASVVRAAEAWRLDGTDDAIREHAEHQLALAETIAEQIARARLRALSWDLSRRRGLDRGRTGHRAVSQRPHHPR
jgi:hypothetical protein